jgi:hypothetical protein
MGMPSGKWYYEVKLSSDIDNHTHAIISEFTNTNQSGLQNNSRCNKLDQCRWWRSRCLMELLQTADYGLYTINQISGYCC